MGGSLLVTILIALLMGICGNWIIRMLHAGLVAARLEKMTCFISVRLLTRLTPSPVCGVFAGEVLGLHSGPVGQGKDAVPTSGWHSLEPGTQTSPFADTSPKYPSSLFFFFLAGGAGWARDEQIPFPFWARSYDFTAALRILLEGKRGNDTPQAGTR